MRREKPTNQITCLRHPTTAILTKMMREGTVAAKLGEFLVFEKLNSFYCIPGQKSGILRIQYGHAAATEISFRTR